MQSQYDICPVCASADLTKSLSFTTPVFCNVLYDSADLAVAAPQGAFSGAFCNACGHFFNVVFDEALVEYNQDYETSLHFSGRFQAYAESLVEHLSRTYSITDKNIIELGCGRGDFLKMMCAGRNNIGYGFDQTFRPCDEMTVDYLHFYNDYYSSSYKNIRADIVVCRHVLEHVPNPIEFLESLREIPSWNHDTVVYFEVPNGMYSFADLGIWDFIYEHFSYFNETSLRLSFERSGFEVLAVKETFGGQYLGIEARPDASRKNIDVAAPKKVISCLQDMENNYLNKLASWNNKIDGLVDTGFAVWGAGSKGVSFVNLTARGADARCMVDINPRKHNKFVPGSGQQVVSPDQLRVIPVEHVVVMNPVYTDEIQQTLKAHSIRVEVIAA